jgi:hypothetical protein
MTSIAGRHEAALQRQLVYCGTGVTICPLNSEPRCSNLMRRFATHLPSAATS